MLQVEEVHRRGERERIAQCAYVQRYRIQCPFSAPLPPARRRAAPGRRRLAQEQACLRQRAPQRPATSPARARRGPPPPTASQRPAPRRAARCGRRGRQRRRCRAAHGNHSVPGGQHTRHRAALRGREHVDALRQKRLGNQRCGGACGCACEEPKVARETTVHALNQAVTAAVLLEQECAAEQHLFEGCDVSAKETTLEMPSATSHSATLGRLQRKAIRSWLCFGGLCGCAAAARAWQAHASGPVCSRKLVAQALNAPSQADPPKSPGPPHPRWPGRCCSKARGVRSRAWSSDVSCCRGATKHFFTSPAPTLSATRALRQRASRTLQQPNVETRNAGSRRNARPQRSALRPQRACSAHAAEQTGSGREPPAVHWPRRVARQRSARRQAWRCGARRAASGG